MLLGERLLHQSLTHELKKTVNEFRINMIHQKREDAFTKLEAAAKFLMRMSVMKQLVAGFKVNSFRGSSICIAFKTITRKLGREIIDKVHGQELMVFFNITSLNSQMVESCKKIRRTVDMVLNNPLRIISREGVSRNLAKLILSKTSSLQLAYSVTDTIHLHSIQEVQIFTT
jgi:hypothetical protein